MFIPCRVCGKLWYFKLLDMTKEERELFLEGLGCSCCEGKKPDDMTKQKEEELKTKWIAFEFLRGFMPLEDCVSVFDNLKI